MILDFAWLPPEINSLRIFSGAGSSPLFAAAAAWEGLGADLAQSVASMQQVLADLTGGPWTGPASVSMAAAATPYVSWLSAAAAQADLSAGQARAAATAFETALAATVHPAAVDANRMSFLSLIATNFLGQNTPAIAAAEFDYVDMWAQDVGAMVSYFTGATSVASTLTPFSMPPVSLAGLAQIGAQVTSAATTATAALSPTLQGATTGLAGAVTAVQSAASAVPIGELQSFAQIAMYPASMMISPMMQLAQMGNTGANAAGMASAGMAAADMPKFVGDVAPAMKGLGGGLGGAGMAADLGKAHLVGAMSVPPTWQGSMPKAMASSAMAGMGLPTAAEMAAQAGGATGGGMPMMPMPMGMGGAGAGMPGGMMGRGGANPHVVQQRPSVVPRTGVG